MVAASQHPHIKIMTYSEVEKVGGYIGNFKVTIRKKARLVDEEACTGCGICWEKCPSKVDSEFDDGVGIRKAIYTPFPQAVPNVPVLDKENCRLFVKGRCSICQKKCPSNAIDYEQQDQLLEEEFGAVVVSTGYDLWDWKENYGEYGGGRYPDVITSLQFERMSNASGPTGGKILRPSDGKEPKTVVMIQCVGSRDDAKGKTYCSKACCMYTAKHAHQVIEKLGEDAQAIVFYMDVRTPGKSYEEFWQRSVHEGAVYVRGRVSRIYPEGDQLLVAGEDTLLGKQLQVKADLIVLATAMVPAEGYQDVAKLVGLSYDKDGFFQEAHPKLRPVETNSAGVYLAGACQGPKDIPDTVAQAGAAASKVLSLFSSDEIEADPQTSVVDNALCSGCGLCVPVCPYSAISLVEIAERVPGGERKRTVAKVNEGLCQGCGACTVTCRTGAVNLDGFTDEQILAEVDAICL